MAVDFRYRRLGYVALNVSDVERSAQFYRDFVGLAPAGEALGGERLFRCSARHHDVVLHAGKPGLRRIGWQMESGRDVESVRAHVERLGIRSVDVASDEQRALGISGAFRFTEPNTGATLEYFHAFAEAATPFQPSHTKIARLGHVVLHAANHKQTERFFIDELNFRASDRIENAVTFMRCFPNPLHHSFGLGNANENRLNHVNFMVTDMDDVGRALWRMKKADVPIVFGPGRHPPSGSVFLYFLDPDGMTLEYSFGMEEFPERDAREPRLLPPGLASIDFWGAVPDRKFASLGAIEPLAVPR
jgi:2,3-dihydroxy-p-cumate/2,3-dihydroxybenzoate 3,4-dioxygenase